MSITLQGVETLLKRFGWEYDVVDDYNLLSGWKGGLYEFDLRLHFDDNWLTLFVPDFAPPVPAERQLEVYRKLLQINARMFYWRLALDGTDRIILSADLPGHSRLDFDLFSTVLNSLFFYAEDIYPNLYRAITDEEPTMKGAKDGEQRQ